MCGRTKWADADFQEGPSGQIWLVDRDTEMNLVKGWESFVPDHPLEFRDFLVFNMDNASFLKVHIYGKEGGEKQLHTCDQQLGTSRKNGERW